MKDIAGGPSFCDINEREVNHLVYNPAGNARIHRHAAQEIEPGLRWRQVRLGPRPSVAPGVVQYFTLASQSVINPGGDSAEAVIVYCFIDDLEQNLAGARALPLQRNCVHGSASGRGSAVVHRAVCVPGRSVAD